MEPDCHSSLNFSSQQPAADTAGPMACSTCRLAHVSCDRSVLPPPQALLFLFFGFNLFV
jgi:hypothetical protein